MNSPEPAPGSGFIGYIASLSLMGKLLFGTFLIGVPGDPDLVVRQGRPQAKFQMMCAAMVLIVFNVFFWTLFEQAGSSLTLFADRNTDRERVRAVHALGAADPEFQSDRHRHPGAADEHSVGRAREAQPRAVDPDQVRDRAGRASAPAFCFLVWGSTFAGAGFQGRLVVACRALCASTRSPSCAFRRWASA